MKTLKYLGQKSQIKTKPPISARGCTWIAIIAVAGLFWYLAAGYLMAHGVKL